jgi:hypothetical protein
MLKNLLLRKQMELSKFTNGDKKAIIIRKDYNYTIEYYIKNKIVSKEVTADFSRAEGLAESFILEEDAGGPSLLTENV